MDNLYTVTQVTPNVYNISENITSRPIKFSQQLVVGRDKAALIDASFGIDGDLVAEIRKITDKPITCLLTHGDPDHTGGASLFDTVYMNPEDDTVMKESFNPAFRLHAIDVASGHNKALVAHMTAAEPQASGFNYQPLADGDTFDLGGVTLEVVATPGHSRGSMCFIDVAHHLGFTGDSLATAVMSELYDTRCASLTEWGKSLRKLRDLVGDDAQLFSGHRIDAFPSGILTKLITGVDDIIAGNNTDDKPITMMPTGPVSDDETMKPRTHQLTGTPFVIMYNAVNL